MARQSATQHLDILAAGQPRHRPAARTGTAALPQPGADPRDPGALDLGVRQAPSASDQRHQEPGRGVRHDQRTRAVPTYVYVTYIHASAEQVWQALTDADLTARYWGHANVSDWQPGSTWEHRRVDGSGAVDVVGHVIEAEPPTRLVITFEDAPTTPQGTVGRHLSRRAAPGHRPPHRDPREAPQPGDARRDLARAGRPCWRTSSRCSRPVRSSRRRHGRCRRARLS